MAFSRLLSGEYLALQPAAEARCDNRAVSVPLGRGLQRKILYGLGRSAVALYVKTRLRMDVQWHAPLPGGPKILAVNHPTTTDPFYILAALSEPISVLVTPSAFDLAGFGPYLRATGHVPAVRGSGGATIEAVVRQVEAGHSVAIFPEGALSPLGGGFHEPHSGVGRIALRTGAPVIPVGIGLRRDRIHVTEVNLPSGRVTGHLYKSGPYAVTVGKPLRFEGNAADRARVRAVAGHVMSQIRNLSRESERRIRSVREASSPSPSLRLRGWPAPVRSLR